MKLENFFYGCSKDYIEKIDSSLYVEVENILTRLPKRDTQTEINNDLFWLLTGKGWSYDTVGGVSEQPPKDIDVQAEDRAAAKKDNKRELCISTTTLEASWHADFAKSFPAGLVQIEAQFGTVESMFKDFCGFRIALYEKRLALGVEIVLSEPPKYFAHRKNSVTGMAYFDIARKTLPAINLNCPIWLIGLKEEDTLRLL